MAEGPFVYHLELREQRQVGNVAHAFNMTGQELASLAEKWGRGEQVTVGERRWNSVSAVLTILEGPRLAVHELSMGRGWKAALRVGREVTDEVLGRAGDSQPAPSAPGRDGRTPGAAAEADSLGLGVLELLADGPVSLNKVWRLAQGHFSELPSSECLSLAERAVTSLLERGLVVLESAEPDGPHSDVTPSQAAGLLGSIDTWSEAGSDAVHLRRA